MKQLTTLCFLLLLSFSISVAQEWEPAGQLPTELPQRNHPVNFSLDGKAYIGTGFYAQDGSNFLLEDFGRYDPETDTWEVLPNAPGGVRGFAYGDTTENKGYMGFGINWTDYLNDLWEYDPVTEAWTQLPSCPCDGRRHPAFIAHGGYVHVGLGDNNINGNLKDWWVYNIEDRTWTQAPDLPGVPRHHPYYFGLNGKAYAGFGHGAGIFKDFYMYDPETNEWTKLNDFPGESRVAGTQFSRDGKGYVLSGQGSDHLNFDTGEFWEYIPETDTWVELAPHPGTGRWAPGSFLIDNDVYLIAGRNNFGDQKDMFKYSFEPPTSNEEPLDLSKNVTIYPNPIVDNVSISSEVQWTQMEVYNVLGERVFNAPYQTEVNLEMLTSGAYQLLLSNDENKTSIAFYKN